MDFYLLKTNDRNAIYRLVNIPCVNDEKSYSPPNCVGMPNGPMPGLLPPNGLVLGATLFVPYILQNEKQKQIVIME